MKIWSVVLKLGEKLKWVSSSFGSISFVALIFQGISIHFSSEAKHRAALDPLSLTIFQCPRMIC